MDPNEAVREITRHFHLGRDPFALLNSMLTVDSQGRLAFSVATDDVNVLRSLLAVIRLAFDAIPPERWSAAGLRAHYADDAVLKHVAQCGCERGQCAEGDRLRIAARAARAVAEHEGTSIVPLVLK